MAAVEEIKSPAATPAAAPRWPLFAAPFAGFIYYQSLVIAFWGELPHFHSEYVLPAVANDLPMLAWGTHWIYHTLAEASSVAFGTFVAAGLARERAAIGGLLGGFGIILAIIGIFFRLGVVIREPGYEVIITVIAGIAAPAIGYAMAEMGREVSTQKPTGFAGINRIHFLWLPLPAYAYGASMLELVGKLVNYYFTHSLWEWSSSDLEQILYVVPLFGFAIPMCVGIGLLSGDIDKTTPMRPFLRQTLGVVVLAVGWLIVGGILVAIHQGAARAGIE